MWLVQCHQPSFSLGMNEIPTYLWQVIGSLWIWGLQNVVLPQSMAVLKGKWWHSSTSGYCGKCDQNHPKAIDERLRQLLFGGFIRSKYEWKRIIIPIGPKIEKLHWKPYLIYSHFAGYIIGHWYYVVLQAQEMVTSTRFQQYLKPISPAILKKKHCPSYIMSFKHPPPSGPHQWAALEKWCLPISLRISLRKWPSGPPWFGVNRWSFFPPNHGHIVI